MPYIKSAFSCGSEEGTRHKTYTVQRLNSLKVKVKIILWPFSGKAEHFGLFPRIRNSLVHTKEKRTVTDWA